MWRKNKYNAKKTKSHGYSFDSKLESALYDYLLTLQKAKEISDIRVKPNIYLTDANILMIPDFCAMNNKTGQTEYWESKGLETATWRIKRRLYKFYGPGVLHVYCGTYNNLILRETITPKEPKC
jgi:hypothetical protein